MNLELLGHAGEQAALPTETGESIGNGPLWIVLITFVIVAMLALALKMIAASDAQRKTAKEKEE